MTWLQAVIGAFVGLGIAERIFGFSKGDGMEEEVEVEYTRALFDSKVADLSRETLLRLLAKQMDDADEVSEIDEDTYMNDQFFGVVGFANMDDASILSEYENKIGIDDDEPDFEEIIENLDYDLKYLKENPTTFAQYSISPAPTGDRALLQEFVSLAEHLANESVFYPVEFAHLAVKARNHVNDVGAEPANSSAATR